MDVSIIIVNWNSKDLLRQCLRSVQQHTCGLSYETIVVDSGSFDGAGEMLAHDFPEVAFVQSVSNIGFARANNLGRIGASGDLLLFLNPDTELVANAVLEMAQHLRRFPGDGAVGVKLLNADGSLQDSCVQSFPTITNQLLSFDALRWRTRRSSLWGMSALHDAGIGAAAVDMVSGACLMVSAEAFDRVGGFSEDYFMYSEDLDLCHKLHAVGRRNSVLSRVQVRHFGGGSSNEAPSEFSAVMTRESMWRFFRKTRGSAYAAGYRVSVAIAALVRVGLLTLMGLMDGSPHKQRRQPSALNKWRAILAWAFKLTPISTPGASAS
jgi:N-acetylglucosaminyl-diphospho-decaprenol L-rhamnosyltransferase